MTTIKCPHCTKDFDVEVKAIQSGHTMTTTKPFTESKASDSIRNKPAGDLITTQEAKNLKTKINIEGVCERKGEIRDVNLKSGGQVKTTSIFLVDSAGEIKLTLWGDEVTKVNDGSKIRITNGYTNTYKGEVSLTKGKYGNLELLS